ncbi:MAG: nucleoside-diphosphate kinase [Bacteroidales bacterium]|jgi:nucleoside-diphosphate kinase|nr:nucleoside-diphosphate kinase [Bacteroidales bacterium]MDN5349113.1 nucleoside-diphosphate kinase [Bacteroidales bacterium]
MNGNLTFTMVKPAAVADGHAAAILAKITEGGFNIKALKMTRLSKEQAERFYAIHSDRPFFNSLVASMTAGPIVAALLEKENAVEAFRNYIGATNPADAAEGTIRKLYGKSIEANAVHGSDSDENARIESAYFFSEFERF